MEKLTLLIGHLLVFAITVLTIKAAVGDMRNGWEAAIVSGALFNLGIQHIAGVNARMEIRRREREIAAAPEKDKKDIPFI